MSDFNELESKVEAWTLENDIQLLSALREYSATLGSRTISLIDRVDELSSNVTVAQTRLRNMFNEFMMMSNTQFIENVSL